MCLGKKFGGNAQSISKDRWLHYTSNLLKYNSELMKKYLLMPEKRPIEATTLSVRVI